FGDFADVLPALRGGAAGDYEQDAEPCNPNEVSHEPGRLFLRERSAPGGGSGRPDGRAIVQKTPKVSGLPRGGGRRPSRGSGRHSGFRKIRASKEDKTPPARVALREKYRAI